MKVVFCLPGRTFSHNYFNSWNATIAELSARGISYQYVMGYDPVIYYCRNKLLGGNNTLGKIQSPWQGMVQYDRMIWIDSDMVWTPADIVKLLSNDKPIISGTYLTSDGNHFPIVEHLDYSKLSLDGAFSFLTSQDIASRTSDFQVSYTGFGFLSIKHGVIEQLEYPWFRPKWVETDNFYDFTSEDVGFCWAAKEKGIQIWVDPTIKVGHEKPIIL